MNYSGTIIDAHARLGDEYPFSLEADELLARMDAAGVAMAIARPNGAELVVDNRAGNQRVLSAGPRIRGLVTANPWFGDRAIDELKRGRDGGAVGMFLHPSRQGFLPIEPVAEKVLDFAAWAKWPVMFHTGTYIQSDVLAVAEVARRMPATQFILGYAGYTDMWFELPGAVAEVPNLWADTSLVWSSAVSDIIALGAGDRILFAGGEPRNRYSVVLRALARLPLTNAQRNAIMFENAERLFGLTLKAARSGARRA